MFVSAVSGEALVLDLYGAGTGRTFWPKSSIISWSPASSSSLASSPSPALHDLHHDYYQKHWNYDNCNDSEDQPFSLPANSVSSLGESSLPDQLEWLTKVSGGRRIQRQFVKSGMKVSFPQTQTKPTTFVLQSFPS